MEHQQTEGVEKLCFLNKVKALRVLGIKGIPPMDGHAALIHLRMT